MDATLQLRHSDIWGVLGAGGVAIGACGVIPKRLLRARATLNVVSTRQQPLTKMRVAGVLLLGLIPALRVTARPNYYGAHPRSVTESPPPYHTTATEVVKRHSTIDPEPVISFLTSLFGQPNHQSTQHPEPTSPPDAPQPTEQPTEQPT